ncbi:unnamed protein product, partial [Allacma fusca]
NNFAFSLHVEDHDSDSDVVFANSASSDCSPDEWISDSGATRHVCGNKEWFVNIEQFSGNAPSVIMADNKKTRAVGIGQIRLEAFISGKWCKCTISDVLYVPGAANLFSEPVMDRKKYTIIRKNGETKYSKQNGKPGPEATLTNRGYILKFRPIEET